MAHVRRSFLFALLLLFSSSGMRAQAAEAEPLNVLFIVVDDLKPRLGCFGDKEALTPNIDRLAKRGLVFEHAYVQQAVCGPSRASFLSGLRPDQTGVTENNLHLRDKRPDVTILPAHFMKNGYTSVALGKIHHWDGDGVGSWSEPIWRPYNMGGSTREYIDPASVAMVREAFAQIPPGKKKVSIDTVKGPAWEKVDLLNDIYPDGLVSNMAVQTLKRLSASEKPFFLAVGFIKPHLPFACPKEFWDKYDPKKLTLTSIPEPPAGMPPVAFYDSEELRQYQAIPGPKEPLDESLQRHLLHGYLACTSYMDSQVGKVLDELDRLKLADRTIVVLFGDHGWHLGDNGIWGKCTNFEAATHTPLIISTPKQQSAGQKTSAFAELIDLYPTLSDLCGLPLPKHLQGHSLRSVLEHPSEAGREAVFSQFSRPGNVTGFSVRITHWRYTRWVDAKEKVVGEELYDCRAPEGEQANRVKEPALASTVADLQKRIEQVRRK